MPLADRKPDTSPVEYVVYNGTTWSREDVSLFVRRRGGREVLEHQVVSGFTREPLLEDDKCALTFETKTGAVKVLFPGYVVVYRPELESLNTMTYPDFQKYWQVRGD